MARKHLFPLVVLLAAAAVAGVLALSRTVALGQGTSSANADTAIAYRLEELDRFEASLREQLARSSQPASAPTRTVYRRASAATAHADDDAYEHEDEHEDDERDD